MDDLELTAEEVVAKSRLGLLSLEETIKWASNQIAMGQTGAGLQALAATWETEQAEVDRLLQQLAKERGLSSMSRAMAVEVVANSMALEVIEGRISPSVAARRLWHLSAAEGIDLQAPYIRFVGLVSEWDDDEQHRTVIEADIVSAFHALLGSRDKRGAEPR